MVNFETDSIGNMRRADFAVFSPSVFLKSLLVFLFVLYSSVVCAKPVAYDVVINAPESVKKILMNIWICCAGKATNRWIRHS